METKWIVFTIILIVNACVSFIIALILLRRPPKTGIRSITFMLFGLGIWSFAYAMITLSESLEAKLFWLRVENIGIQSVPVLWFFFAMKYTRLDRWLTGKPSQFLFWIIPVISLVFLFSEDLFHYYYTHTQVAAETGGPLLISRGPMYWVALSQTYPLSLAGTAALIWRFLRSRTTYRKQTPYLIGAVAIPFAINIVYQIAPNTIPIFEVPVDLTPLSFNIAAILLAASIFGLHLFDLVPIARDTVMEHIPEMVFVVDVHDRVIDANAIAQKWLGKSLSEIEGKDPVEVFRGWPQLLNRFFFTEYSREEIEIPGNPPHTLEIIVTPIYNRMNALEGRVILARDITERKLLENQLKSLNQSLQNQLDENERLRLQLQEQAIRDPLTGVFNRRFFAEALDRETAQATRENTPFSIIIMDVDHFKQFNDTYGHKCGDVVLLTLAKFLTENTRRGDIVCRYGGEEFVILMPDATTESAYERAEFFRKEFEKSRIEYDGKILKSTFSAGVASFPTHAHSGETLLNLADHALYQSKADGRNRVTVYSSQIQHQNLSH
ncbi:MAG: diguanylate cyclase [Chloroflexi bacterium]|nr:diguanylate cyclase [Chloroflexota bacterium]